MLTALLLLSAAIDQPNVRSQPPPPPLPLGIPDRLPTWRLVETAYRCGNEEVRFTIRYDDMGGLRIIGGRRGTAATPARTLQRINAGLQDFDTVASVVPVCAGEVHSLTAAGTARGRAAEMVIVWTPHAITPSPVLPPVGNER